jgi:Probable lipid transfer
MEGKFVILFSSLSLFLLPSKAQFFGLSGFPSCVPVLSPCLNYLHSETPPPSCCIPLENAIEEQGDCLCSAFKDKNLLDKIKMTQDEMLKFPTKCGLSLPENTNCSAALSSKSILWFFFRNYVYSCFSFDSYFNIIGVRLQV